MSQWCGCQFPLEKRPVLLFKAVAKFPTAGKMRSTSLPSLLPSASMPLLPKRRLKAHTVLGFAPTHCGELAHVSNLVSGLNVVGECRLQPEHQYCAASARNNQR